MLSYTLATTGEDGQTPTRDSDGCLIIMAHDTATGARVPVLHVPRTVPPFTFSADEDAAQMAFAQRVLIALRLAGSIVREEDSGLDVTTLAMNVLDRVSAAQRDAA